MVVTFNRPESLARTLASLETQTRPPDAICVVDNGEPSATEPVLADRASPVRHLRMDHNEGYGGGLAAGMIEMLDATDEFLLLDDDSQPPPAAVAMLSSVLAAHPRAGIVGTTGGVLRWGCPRSDQQRWSTNWGDIRLRGVDYSMVDCALVTASAVRGAGVPDPELFMSFEDVEYTDRVRRAGFDVLVLDVEVQRDHLGSAALWRSYYSTRNQLLVAVQRRQLSWVLGWAGRTTKLILGPFLARSPRAVPLARMRVRGAIDGIRGRSGPTLDPAASRDTP